MDQLELPNVAKVVRFRHRRGKRPSVAPPQAPAVIAFPTSRRAALVETIAQGLQNLEGQEREGFWMQTCLHLAHELRRIGQKEHVVAAHLRKFQIAVQRRLVTSDEPQPGRHDGGYR